MPSNEKNQPKKSETSEEPKVRKSRIRKGIQRTLSTAKYEGLVIHDEIDEEIEWTTLEEREKKIKNWTTLLIKGFKQTHDRVLNELQLCQKRAYFKNYLEEQDNRPEPGSELDDLENLDTLG